MEVDICRFKFQVSCFTISYKQSDKFRMIFLNFLPIIGGGNLENSNNFCTFAK